MHKKSHLMIMILTLLLTACGSARNTTGPALGNQNGPASGALSVPLQVAIGTIKLDETNNAVTAKQAADLLPLWQTLQVLESSDTAAQEEKDALLAQIQETMTMDQMQAITTLNLTRQDMFAILQSQGGLAFGNSQSGNTQNGTNRNSSNNNRRNFNSSGGGFAGGPPDGGFPGGGPGFQGQGTSRTQSNNSTQNSNRQVAADPNRLPTLLIQAVIEYLKKKAGS